MVKMRNAFSYLIEQGIIFENYISSITITMRTRPRLRIKENAEVRAGNILIAKPFWQEEIYKRSVILLIDVCPEGSTGLILNKVSNLSVFDALPELMDKDPLFFGGPISKKTISYIHTNNNLPDSFYLGNDLYWGGNYESLLEMSELGTISLKSFLFCAGFVQWEPGQLQIEMAEDKWWVSEINSDELFHVPSENLWGEKLVEDNHVYGLFNLHPDPSQS